MRSEIYEAEHELFRESVVKFLQREAIPFHEAWEHEGIVPREIWRKAGDVGLLGLGVPEEYGGSGFRDFRFNAVVAEELARAGTSGLGFALQNDIMAPYLTDLTTDEQRHRWLPGFSNGELITAVAMTEPGAGSDLQGIQTTAHRDGDAYIVNGQKTFISNGINADLVITAVRVDNTAGSGGMALLGIERGMPGFERGRNLDKVGLKAQDTAEMYFTDVRVPRQNLIGEEGKGFAYLMQNLPQERLSIAVSAVAGAEGILGQTIDYCRERTAFGQSIGSFQNTRFVLAELTTEVDIARTYVDRAITRHNDGALTATDAAKAKWWTTELANKVMDRCLQLHGGYGYMMEYPVAKAWADARIQSIYGGTTEIMKEIIGRSLEL